MKTINYLQFLGAMKITALARGRLARRQFQTEKALKVIYTSHPLLIKYALRSKPGEKKVFWYKREVERKMLFANYIILVEKTGNNPPRIIVERNLQEIAIRILIRKNELIVLLQKIWRGFLSRRIVKYFRTELSRMFSINVAKVIRIQATYRGHHVRVNMGKYYYHRFHEKTMEKYLNERKLSILLQDKQNAKAMSLYSYKKDHQLEKTARYIGKVPYATDYNDPLKGYKTAWNEEEAYKRKIFQQSNLSDDKTLNLLKEDIQLNSDLVDNANSFIYKDIYRKQFIMNRIDEKGPYGYGKRSGEADFVFASYDNSNSNNNNNNNGILTIEEGHVLSNKNNNHLSDSRRNSRNTNNHNSSSQQLNKSATNRKPTLLLQNNNFNNTIGTKNTDNNDASTVGANDDISSLQSFVKLNLLKQPETSRQKSMRYYFQQDLTDIANRVVERVNKGQPPLGAVDMTIVEKTIKSMKKKHLLQQLKFLAPRPALQSRGKLRKQELPANDPAKRIHDQLKELEGIPLSSSSPPQKEGRQLLAIGNGTHQHHHDEDTGIDDNSSITNSLLSGQSLSTVGVGGEKLTVEKKQRLKFFNDLKKYNQAKLETKQLLEAEQLKQQQQVALYESNPPSRKGSSQDRQGRNSRKGSRATPNNNNNLPNNTGPTKARKNIQHGFAYPKEINFDSMSWLYSNEDC
jgi:hypothetical protein